jgi:hypothetical protein
LLFEQQGAQYKLIKIKFVASMIAVTDNCHDLPPNSRSVKHTSLPDHPNRKRVISRRTALIGSGDLPGLRSFPRSVGC